MNSSNRDVRLGIEVGVTGDESIRALAKDVQDLAAKSKEANAVEAAARKDAALAKSAYDEKQEAIRRLRIETTALGRSTADFTQAERTAKSAILDANVVLRQKREAVADAAAATKAATVAEAAMRTQLQGAQADYRRLSAAAKESGDATRKSVDDISAGFGRLGLAVGGALTGREFIETISAAESLKRGLGAITGSAERADDELGFLKKTSNELGIEVQSAGRAYLSLTAATQGTTLEGEKTRAVFTAVSRAMSTLGKSSAETENALRAVAQMASKGTVSMEELRGQLGEALPGALKAAADGAGVTTAQLIAMVESGNVLASDLLPALTKGLDNLYANGGPPETLTANFNRLTNTIKETAVALGEGGVGKGLTKTAGAAAVALLGVGESLTNVGADIGEFAAAVGTGNFQLGTQAERLAESERKVKSLATTAGLTAPEVAKIGTAAEDAGRKARDAFNQFERAADTAGGSVSKLGTVTVDLATKFDAIRAKGDSAAEAVAKIGKDFDLSTSPGIVAAEDVLNRLLISGRLTATEFGEAWRNALKGIDLSEFEQRARKAFEGAAGEARKLQAVVDAIANESFRRAGTSAEELRTGISAASRSAIADLDVLSQSLVSMGASGADAARVLGTSLGKALESANTERSINAVIDRIDALGKQGLLSGEQVAAGMERARAKIDALLPGVQGLDEALRNFGLQTTAQVQATADKLGASYQQIANSTSVSLADQRRAFDQYAAAATAANKGIEPSAVSLARAMLEIREAGSAAGRGIEDGARRGGAALDALASKARATAGAIDDGFNAKVTRSGKDSEARSDAINSVAADNSGADLLVEKIRKGTVTEADRALVEGALSAARVNARFSQGNANVSLEGQREDLERLRAFTSARDKLNSPGQRSGPSAPADGAGPASGGPPATYKVDIVIGGRSTTVNAASANDAAALASLLQQLGDAANRAGT